MSSVPSVLLGKQEPRLSSVPPYDTSDGDLAVEYADSVGLHLDPWQRLVMFEALGRRAGQWAAYEVDITVGRQNGKGALLEARELSGIEIFGNRLIIHTAHELKTAEEARLRMEQLCEASPDLDRRVMRVVRTNGKEAIEFFNTLRTGVGARIKYQARSKGSGRGFAGADLVVMDEKMFLRADAMAALLPTLSASPDPQVWYTGSAHFADSDQQVALRERMLAGNDPELAAFEWSVPDGSDLDDPQVWAVANPALGYRMSEKFLTRERGALAEADFAREHLGIGGGGSHQTVIDVGLWGRLEDERSRIVGRMAFAIDVTPDRRYASVATCGPRSDGRLHVEVMENKRGTGWVAEWVAERLSHEPCAVVVDKGSPAGSLIPELEAAGAPLVLIGAQGLGQACGAFFDAVHEDRVRHIGQPPLDLALGAARKRPLGDAWAWHRRDATDISPLVAVTLAHYGLTTSPEPEPEDSRVVVFR